MLKYIVVTIGLLVASTVRGQSPEPAWAQQGVSNYGQGNVSANNRWIAATGSVGSGNDGSTRYTNISTGQTMENYHYLSHRRLSHDSSGSVMIFPSFTLRRLPSPEQVGQAP